MKSITTLLIVAFAAFILANTAYTVSEAEQVFITQFGKPVGQAINSDPAKNEAGLHFKKPFIQKVNRIEKRILDWDGPVTDMPTRDKLYIAVDAFARWRIVDPITYYEKLRDEALVAADSNLGLLPPIREGRLALTRKILEDAQPKVRDLGIELLDVRFKRINYKSGVIEKIYARMASERLQIAERFRSEGAGEAAKIIGRKERDLLTIESGAYRREQEIRGKADAEATGIYSRAYTSSASAADFYQFTKTLETYQKTLGKETTAVFTTDSDLFRLFKTLEPADRQ